MEYLRGVLESVNPKLAPSHSKIELTRTHNVFSPLPEVSTEGVALARVAEYHRKTDPTQLTAQASSGQS